MMSAFMKRMAVVAAGSTALTLGLSNAAQAIGFSVTAQTAGGDSGADRVIRDIQASPTALSSTLGAAISDSLGGSPVANTVGQIAGGAAGGALGGLASSLDDGTGENNFFSVGLQSAPGANVFIRSLTFDLAAGGDMDASFDNRDFLLFDATPALGQVFGIDPSQISFSPVGRNEFLPNGSANITSRLTIGFEDGDFGSGDFFTFGADTNAVGEDTDQTIAFINNLTGGLLSSLTNDDIASFNDGGGDFGDAGVGFLAEIVYRDSTGAETIFNGDASFFRTGDFSSVANISGSFDNAHAVPTPALLPGLLGFGASLLKKRRKLSAEAS